MSTTENDDKGKRMEKIAGSANQKTISPGSGSAENYCPPAKPEDAKDKEAMSKYRDQFEACKNHLLREIRVEIQEIARILDGHAAGDLDLKSHLHELDSSKAEIAAKIEDLKDNYLSRIAPQDFYSEILNLWQMAEGSPYFDQIRRDEFLDRPEQDRLREINILKKRLSRLSFLIEYSTGLERVNDWVKGARPGYALPFHSMFEDEMKSPEDRQKILNLYSLQPEIIRGGLIDPVKGVILCYPQNAFDRLLRHAMILLFIAFSFFAVYQVGEVLSASNNISNLLGIKSTDGSFLLMCWAALLIGIGGHVLVTGAKTSNVEFRQFPLPLRDWDFYLSARTTMILYKTTLSMFVFFALYVMVKGEIRLLDSFLIGYSFDSVVELVGVSLEKRSAGSINAIKEKLAATG